MTTHRPSAILFICYLNSIRSPMAEGLMKKHFGDKVYVQSCGLSAGELDDLMVSVMSEKGIDMSKHNSRSLQELGETSFDLVIAFTAEAGEGAKSFFVDTDTCVEIWPMPDPTQGILDVRAMMNNYRAVRDRIESKLLKKFT